MEMPKEQIKCLYFDTARDKCNCPALKKWYGKPRCVLRENWNNHCTYKHIL